MQDEWMQEQSCVIIIIFAYILINVASVEEIIAFRMVSE